MKISIDPYDRESIMEARKALGAYRKEFTEKVREFGRRLAEEGIQVAQTGYALADYDGVKDVTVWLQKTKTGYEVVASGKTVGFLEFGTGIRYPEWDNQGMPYTPPPHGSYGKHQGLNPHGWWFGHGHHTYGNMPAEAMRTARDVMIERVITIAEEVWNTHD